jgi:hypothetical protein
MAENEVVPTRWRSAPVPTVGEAERLVVAAYRHAGPDASWPEPAPWGWYADTGDLHDWPNLASAAHWAVGRVYSGGRLAPARTGWAELRQLARRLWGLPPAITLQWLGYRPGPPGRVTTRPERLVARATPGASSVQLSIETAGLAGDSAAIAAFRLLVEDEAARAKPPKVDWAYSADVTLADPAEVVDYVDRLMAARHSTELVECSWSVTPPADAPYPPEMARSLALYDAVAAADIPANEVRVQFSGMTEDLAPLEVLQPLVGPDGSVSILAGWIEVDEARAFELWYVTMQDGHHLDVYSEQALDPAAVQALLPIEFRDIGPELDART